MKGCRTPRRPISFPWRLPQASLQGRALWQNSASSGSAWVGEGVSWMCWVPGSFMPPHRCPWARACLVLRFRVSIQGNEGKSYPRRLLCQCVEIKLELLVVLSPIPSPLYFSLLSLNTNFNYIFICGINYSVSALWVQGECLPHAPEDPGPSTVLVYVGGTQ